MKIILTREDVTRILTDYIYYNFKDHIAFEKETDITFNSYILPFEHLVFEKAEPKEWRESTLEDARDMAAEIAKVRGEHDEA